MYEHGKPNKILNLPRELELSINDVDEWMSTNRLKLNPDKTEDVWYSTSHSANKIVRPSISVRSAVISPSSCVHSLGV